MELQTAGLIRQGSADEGKIELASMLAIWWGLLVFAFSLILLFNVTWACYSLIKKLPKRNILYVRVK
jgi:hypothetical protein